MNFEMTHTKKFRSTAAAIFWMMEREKRGDHAGKFEAFTRGDTYPCQPIDLKKIIYRLVRENKLTVKHVTALRFIGSRGERPDTTPHTKQICGLWITRSIFSARNW